MPEILPSVGSEIKLTLQSLAPIAVVSNLDPMLEELSIGEKFSAIITSKEPNGLIRVKTKSSTFSFQTNLPIRNGNNLQLQLISNGHQKQLLITAVDGSSPNNFQGNVGKQKPISSAVENVANNSQTSFALSSKTSDSVAISLISGMTTNLTYLSRVTFGQFSQTSKNTPNKDENTSNTLAAPKKLDPKGSKSNILTKSLTKKVSLIPHNLFSQKNVLTKNMNAVFQIGSKQNISSQNEVAPPATGSRARILIKDVILPTQLSISGGLPRNRPPPLFIGQILTGVVIGNQGNSHSIVQSHGGPIAIDTRSALPPGTTISFEILSFLPKLTATTDNALERKGGLIIQETREWKGLNEAVRAIGETNLAIAQQAVNAAVPRLDSTFTANVLLFIAGIRGTDIRNLFGDAPIRLLQRIRPNLLASLNDDFQQISRLSDEDGPNEWRTIPIPIVNGKKIEQICLFMRKKNRSRNKNNSGLRFIIDINLSHIGRFQLDGLVNEGKKKFDLIVRTNTMLTRSIETKINSIFFEASEIAGVAGKVTFRTSPPIFIDFSPNGDIKDDHGWIV